MLDEKRATSVRYDAATDVATIELESGSARATEEAEVTLLLAADGLLVGVDLGGEGPGRVVVMIGRHEDVTRTRPARAQLGRTSRGGLARVVVPQARGLVHP